MRNNIPSFLISLNLKENSSIDLGNDLTALCYKDSTSLCFRLERNKQVLAKMKVFDRYSNYDLATWLLKADIQTLAIMYKILTKRTNYGNV